MFTGKWLRITNSVNEGAFWRVSSGNKWADYDKDGTLVGKSKVKAGWVGCEAPTEQDLATWANEMQIILARTQNAITDNIYIRWGKLPKGGKSKNHTTGELEAGVSVYSARYNPITTGYDYDDDALADAAIRYLMLGYPVYLVTGEQIGHGSDGEPVLANVTIIGQLRPTKDGFSLA